MHQRWVHRISGRRAVGWGSLLPGLAFAFALPGCDDDVPIGEPVHVKATLGGLGDTPGRFACPRCLEADASTNTLWVIDKTGRVQQIDPKTGACLCIWKMPLTENGKPTGCTIAIDDDGRPLLYVADTHYHRVMIYRADVPVGNRTAGKSGTSSNSTEPVADDGPPLVASFGEYGTKAGQFIFPTDIAIVPKANGRGVSRIFVSEYGGNDRISAFDASFNCLFTFGTYGNDAAASNIQFDRPQSMIVTTVKVAGSEPRLVVADSRNHRLGSFTLEGKLIGWFGDFEHPGNGLGEFRIPYGLHDLGDGTALVAEYGNNRVQRLDLATGAGLGAWGTPGRGEGELFTPWAVMTLGTMTYVLDTGNNRVLGFATPRRRSD